MVPPIFDPGLETAFHADGFVTVERLIPEHVLSPLHERFDRLFRGEFETGIEPNEVIWLEASGDPTLTRQLCNGWRADRLVAAVVMASGFGEAIAGLAGWPLGLFRTCSNNEFLLRFVSDQNHKNTCFHMCFVLTGQK